MASFSQSTIENGYEIFQDFLCSTCEDVKLEESADFHCELCMRFYCRKCIIPHDQLFIKHSPCGKEDMKKWPVSKKVEDFLQKCVVHKDINLEMYCQDHSRLCCNKCASIDHRRCKTVTLISDFAKNNSIDLQQQSDCMKRVLEELKQLQDNKFASIRAGQNSYEDQVQKILETRRKIIEALDHIEKKTLTEMKDTYTKLQSSLKGDVDKCATLRDELKQLRDAMQEICDKSNLSLSFIASRKFQDIIQQADAYLKKNSVHVQVSIAFEPNNEIEKYLSKLSGFGKIKNRTQTLTMQGYSDQSQGEQRPHGKRALPPIPGESSLRFDTDEYHRICDKYIDTKPVEKALVRYSYVGEHEDELSLTEGEIINVLDKDLEYSGLWCGELNGGVRTFPDNFVELIKEEVGLWICLHALRCQLCTVCADGREREKGFLYFHIS
ncbi:uncharacterized protein LOC127861445 isoform X2 [Dreissena polymorpha]|uniref:uncharacterized protein LOC127861445 isoform X2 n=1 Tax=Dreissena polymorpha TaxID=45954 RepID=UPI002263E7A1|nr:uncharacterized protein LOC127861445 isoform X2 [Dreissena polymorpha]